MGKNKIKRVTIVGAGNQGSRIAYRCSVSGIETMVYDKFPQALLNCEERILKFFDQKLQSDAKSVAKQKLIFTNSLSDCCENSNLIIEAVPESIELKRKVWAEIDKVAPIGAYLCTNSSSLICSDLFVSIGSQEKIFNINFSDPVNDDLVQIMKGSVTANETLIVGIDFIRSLGMIPIITYKEIMGQSFNRIWRAIKRECLHLVDEGYSEPDDVDRAWMLQFQTEYGPFGLMDIVGLDVVRDIEKQYYIESGDERDNPPPMLEKMVNNGRLGVKTGQGFYTYPNPAYQDPTWLRKNGQYKEKIVDKLREE